jgi:hypothetical protein
MFLIFIAPPSHHAGRPGVNKFRKNFESSIFLKSPVDERSQNTVLALTMAAIAKTTKPRARYERVQTLMVVTSPATVRMAREVAKAKGMHPSKYVEGLILADVRNHVINGGMS